MLGEIKLFPFFDVPKGFVKCDGRQLNKNEYPSLYMLIGHRFGEGSEVTFKVPDLSKLSPENLQYCIAIDGDLPEIEIYREGKK